MDMKLYLFTAGYEIDDQSFFTLGRGIGTNRKISSQFFLIEHPQGRLLFDTGLNPAVLSRPDKYEITKLFQPIVTEADLAPNRLREINLKPDQIDLVANSHLHYDHAGGNIFFKHATFLVQFDEIQSAMWPEPFSGLVAENYCREDFDLPVRYEQLDGDYDVFGDQRVVLIKTPGHTRGHQSLIVRLPEKGTVILTQDAVYLLENLDNLILSAVCWDQRLMYQSYCRIRELRRLENAFIVPGHDLQAWEKLLHAPEFYA
jgi:N-acyl homoserine lactone hydrolase